MTAAERRRQRRAAMGGEREQMTPPAFAQRQAWAAARDGADAASLEARLAELERVRAGAEMRRD